MYVLIGSISISFQELGVVIVCSIRRLETRKQVLVWSVRAVSCCLVFVGASRQSAVGGVMRCYASGESGAPRPTTPVVSTVLQHLNTGQPSGLRQGRVVIRIVCELLRIK